MSKNTSFSLGDHSSAFIETQVARGRYASASDVVRAGLRLMEEQEAKLDVLRSALIAGEESGYSTSFDFDEFIAGKRAAAISPAAGAVGDRAVGQSGAVSLSPAYPGIRRGERMMVRRSLRRPHALTPPPGRQ